MSDQVCPHCKHPECNGYHPKAAPSKLEQEIERILYETIGKMYPRKTFPVSHCNYLRNALREFGALCYQDAAKYAETRNYYELAVRLEAKAKELLK